MSDDSRRPPNNTIYKEFCNGMRNQSREHIRLAGNIARRISRGTNLSRTSDTLNTSAANFCQIETHLENIENNLNKVSALTRNTR